MNIHYHLFLFLISGTTLLAMPPSPTSPTADSPNAGLRIHYHESSDAFHLSWWGTASFYYFIEQSEDLQEWSFVPTVEAGLSDPLVMAFQSNADRLFWRLKYSNDPQSSLLSREYNGVGLSAWDQLQLGYNPFEWVDTIANGLPDVWELFWFGAIGGVDPTADLDHDGMTVEQEFLSGTDPTRADHPLVDLMLVTPLRGN